MAVLWLAACGGTSKPPTDMGPGHCQLGSPRGTCLTFTPVTTIAQINWNAEMPTSCGLMEGKLGGRMNQYSVAATCAGATTSPGYSLEIDLYNGFTACAGSQVAVPIKSGDSVPIPTDAQTAMAAQVPYAQLLLSSPSGAYLATGGNISITDVTETSLALMYTATIAVPGASGSWSISGIGAERSRAAPNDR